MVILLLQKSAPLAEKCDFSDFYVSPGSAETLVSDAGGNYTGVGSQTMTGISVPKIIKIGHSLAKLQSMAGWGVLYWESDTDYQSVVAY